MISALKQIEQAASNIAHPSDDVTEVDASVSSTSTDADQSRRSGDARRTASLGSKIVPPRGKGRRLKNLSMMSRQLAV